MLIKRLVCARLLTGWLAVGFLAAWAFSGFALEAQTAQSRQGPAPIEAPPPAIKNVFWQPPQLKQGSVAFITVELNRVPLRVSGTWIGKTLTFSKSENPKIWYALAGADLQTQPGTYDLSINAILPGGKPLKLVKPVDVTATEFKTGAVEVPENFVEPDAAEQKQIARDDVLKNRGFAHLTPKPLWSGDFIKPVNGGATDSFGESRLLNEEKTSTHRGTDFMAKEGSAVWVSNSGTVVLAKELFYEGKCVIVDHGERFFTIYMHLSRIDVKAGEKLKKGTQIGLSGATGRVTGPHLHMGVRWNGSYLDPVQLLALTLPNTQSNAEKPSARHGHRSVQP
jgi:hypothetical protein